jgi:DNA-binding PadR family transcriptional regulator
VSLRHAVLGLLARKPSTGYELTALFDRSLGTSWRASHSQIYPELARLERDGLATVVATGARGSRTWDVTDAGREELRRWLLEVEPDRSQRSESGVRLFLTLLLPPHDRLTAYRRDLAWVEDQLVQLGALRAEIEDLSDPAVFGPQVDFGLRVNGAIRDWLVEQVTALEEQLAGG